MNRVGIHRPYVNSVGILVYYNIIIIIMIMCIDKSSVWFIECLYRNDDIIISRV